MPDYLDRTCVKSMLSGVFGFCSCQIVDLGTTLPRLGPGSGGCTSETCGKSELEIGGTAPSSGISKGRPELQKLHGVGKIFNKFGRFWPDCLRKHISRFLETSHVMLTLTNV